MPLETSMFAALPATLTFLVKGVQTGYELQQVPEETRALRETIESTRSDIIEARERRIALAAEHNGDDFSKLDRAVRQAEAALIPLEKLVEQARLDVLQNKGKIKSKTRLMWVVRDSKSVAAINARLALAHQQMSTAMLMIEMRYQHKQSNQVLYTTEEPPPPYVLKQKATMKAVAKRRKEDEEKTAMLRSLRHNEGVDQSFTTVTEETNASTASDQEQELLEPMTFTAGRSCASPTTLPALSYRAYTVPRFQSTRSSIQPPHGRGTAFSPPRSQNSAQSVSLPHRPEIAPVSTRSTYDPALIEPRTQHTALGAFSSGVRFYSQLPSLPELDSAQVKSSAVEARAERLPSTRLGASPESFAPRGSNRHHDCVGGSSKPTTSAPYQSYSSRMAASRKNQFKLRVPVKLAQNRSRSPHLISPESTVGPMYPFISGAAPLMHMPVRQDENIGEFMPESSEMKRKGLNSLSNATSDSSGVVSIQQSFAGHRQPVNVRWQPFPDENFEPPGPSVLPPISLPRDDELLGD